RFRAFGQLLHHARALHVLGEVEVMHPRLASRARDERRQLEGTSRDHRIMPGEQRHQLGFARERAFMRTQARALIGLEPLASLLAMLREDARTPTSVLARALGVARTTIVERLKRLQRDGIVSGYTVRLNPRVQGRMMRVHVLLSVDAKRGEAVVEGLRAIPQV